MVKVTARDLREKSKDELLKQLTELKQELLQLRCVKNSNSNTQAKSCRVRVVRKNIARVLTVYNQSQKAALRAEYKGAKFVPKDLRLKKTRKMRRALSKKQASLKPTRLAKRQQNFPQRKFVLRND